MISPKNLHAASLSLLSLAATLILSLGCSRADISSVDSCIVIDVTDFGAIPDDGKDDTHAVRKALDNLREMKQTATLNFPPGKYDFFSESATTAHYPVTAVHKQWDFITPFHLDGLEVKDGNVVLPSGKPFRLLVLPDTEFMRPVFARKVSIHRLS